MARVIIRDEDQGEALASGREIVEALREAQSSLGAPARIRGPFPCALSRVAGQHRIAVELLAPSAGVIQQLLTHCRNRGLLKSDVHTAVDVDPVAML